MLELDFLDEDFLCFLAEDPNAYCRYMYIGKRGSRPPTFWFVRGSWVGQGPCGCYYHLIFIFIPGSICSPVMNITFFLIFNLNGSFDLTFSSQCLYKHLWLLWKDTIQFHLVHSCTFSSTKIKHFLGEDGYILYKIEWKSANITFKNIPWDDPLDPVPFTDILKYDIKTYSLLLSLPKKGCIYTRRTWTINVAFKE